MIKHWLTGAAAFAMMTGVALAQGVPSDSSTTTSKAPAVGSYKSSETHMGLDRDGNVTHVKKTYHASASGAHATTRTRTVLPNGAAQMTSHERRTDVPYSGSSTEKKTTTTTMDH